MALTILALGLLACGDSEPVARSGSPTTPSSPGNPGTPGQPTPMYGPKTTVEDGYITLADGTRLRYHMERATDAPPGPVALQYDGYDAGTGGYFSNIPNVKAELLKRGYTNLGVNLRGTGCSSGKFSLFQPQWAVDGADTVEWAAKQPWSDGNIGMIGYSFPGVMQLFTAAQRPPHLRAIAPGNVVFDLYRDVAVPGGVPNLVFASLFTVQQQGPGTAAVPQVAANDPECAANYAANKAQYEAFAAAGPTSPYIDDSFGWLTRSPMTTAAQIDVPVLNILYWQDEQVGSRIGGLLEPGGLPSVLDIRKTWSIWSNGNHDLTTGVPVHEAALLQFYDHYLRGIDNGWERTPHVQILHDLRADNRQPSWITRYDRLPQPRVVELFLRAGQTLNRQSPPAAEPGDGYVYPLPSPSTNPLPDTSELNDLWSLPAPEAGRVLWTTPALAQDVQTLGSASADLWLTATASDVDLQATVTEVRPDGQEVYVARGWLRASKRALDAARSTPTRPFHLFTRASAEMLTAGAPVLARLEVLPFAHRFRKGSAIRLIVDAPTGITGNWGWSFIPVPASITILHDAQHPSKLVLGLMDEEPVVAPAPLACGLLAYQPCRDSIADVPPGTLSLLK